MTAGGRIGGIYVIDATGALRLDSHVANHTIAFLLLDDLQPLDLVGPHEVFVGANDAADHLGRSGVRYDVELVAPTLEPVVSESGLAMMPTTTLADMANLAAGEIGTIVVPGGRGARSADAAMIEWLRRHGPRAQRVATICTGAFVAAAAGLCDGRRVTTHWAFAGELASCFPDLSVDPDPIYIEDSALDAPFQLWTSAGVTSGIDLSLAIVERDLGAEVARLVARHLVVYLHRPGGQSQFAAPVWADATEVAPIKQACEIIHRELDGDLSAHRLAADVGLSTRHFTRRFRTEIGEPVGRHVERLRVEAARQILETEHVGLDAVARRCGFGTAETLRRAFHRRLQISPDAYRRSFRTTANPAAAR